MHKKIVTCVLLIMFLGGCATTRKGQDSQLQELRSHVSYLEAELKRKDAEISDLENELGRTYDKSLGIKKEEDIVQTKMSSRQIQIALKNAGFYTGPIDGMIGPQTKKAIKVFQKANNLIPDGIVGKKTLSKLRKYL